jgi:hypothetical protein
VGVGVSALTQAGAAQAATTSSAPLAANPLLGQTVGGKLVAGKLAGTAASGLALKAGVGAVLGTGLVASAIAFVPDAVSERTERDSIAAPSVAPAPESSAQAAVESDLAIADGPALREEIVLLDEARAALARGNAAGARSALERYRASFPSGALLREARVLWARAGAGPWLSGEKPPATGSEGAPRH